MHHAPLGNDHDNRWLFGKNLTAILHVKDVLAPNMGMFTLLNLIMFVICEVTIGVSLNCTCHDFVSMLTSSKKEENVSFANICISYIELGCIAITHYYKMWVQFISLHSVDQ